MLCLFGVATPPGENGKNPEQENGLETSRKLACLLGSPVGLGIGLFFVALFELSFGFTVCVLELLVVLLFPKLGPFECLSFRLGDFITFFTSFCAFFMNSADLVRILATRAQSNTKDEFLRFIADSTDKNEFFADGLAEGFNEQFSEYWLVGSNALLTGFVKPETEDVMLVVWLGEGEYVKLQSEFV